MKEIKNPLQEQFEYEAKILELEFKEASKKGRGTPAEVSDFRENYFNKFLERYFPNPHKITKGQIIDSYGNKSNSIDSLVLSPSHPYMIDSQEKFNLILADGVDLAIELKPNLTSNVELYRGLEQIRTVKKLRRVKTPMLTPTLHGHDNQRVEYSKTIPSFIFCLQAPKNLVKFTEKILKYYTDKSIPVDEQIDYLIVAEQGVIENIKPINKKQYENKSGFIVHESEYPLLHFLYFLNIVDYASHKLQQPILTYYFKGLKSKERTLVSNEEE